MISAALYGMSGRLQVDGQPVVGLMPAFGQLSDADGVLREALDVAGASGPDRAAVLGALAHVAHGRERRQDARHYLLEALQLASTSGAHELVASLETLRRSIAS